MHKGKVIHIRADSCQEVGLEAGNLLLDLYY